jgi:hypothetical protein
MSAVLCDVTLCRLVEIYIHFGGMYCLHLHGRRVSQASSKRNAIFWDVMPCSLVGFKEHTD